MSATATADRGGARRATAAEPTPRRVAAAARRLRSVLVAAASIGVAAATPGPASPQGAPRTEEILSYDVTIDVEPGGRMIVTEEIMVRALGNQIRRGIYRDFPTSFPRESGFGRIEAPFEPLLVQRDGRPEPYTLSAIGGPVQRGGMQIRIGDPGVLVDPGVHTYTIRYATDRWIVFGSDVDQLYWNVTGHGWAFPILSASARVRIPEPTGPPTLEAWTGPEGSTASDADFTWDPGERAASFSTTRELGSGEGLTVRLTFPSGQLTPPTEEQQAAWFGLDWGGYVDAGYVVLFVIAVYLLMWRQVGIDPASRPTGPRSEPPAGFSPAALGYLERRGYDMSHLAAAIVSMATKGALRIERDGPRWRLHKLDDSVELTPDEAALFRALLGSRSRITLEQSQHATLRAAIKAFRRVLARQLEREYFVNNRKWFAAGLAVSVVGFATLAWRWRFDIDPTVLFLGIWLTAWTAGVATLGVRVAQLFTAGVRGGDPAAWAGFAFLGLFSLPFFAAEIGVGMLALSMAPTHLALAAMVIGGTNIVFYHLLERPTLKGRGILDHLEGFRAYLDPEAERAPVERDPDALAFERYLPHAIALGLETRWASGFGDVLGASATLGVTPAGPRPLGWFDSDDIDGFDTSSFAGSLGSGLASTLSSASSPPSSGGGSGGGGGGSSGGGGGGGGGGGW